MLMMQAIFLYSCAMVCTARSGDPPSVTSCRCAQHWDINAVAASTALLAVVSPIFCCPCYTSTYSSCHGLRYVL
jgi:hypothetical protein